MSRPRLEIRWSTLAEVFNHGVEEMLQAHYEEVPNGLPLDPDWPQYRRMERIGAYKVLGAFAGDELAGYSAFFVQPTPQHRSTVQAINDVLYLAPAHRRGLAGARLIREAEPLLRRIGAKRIIYFSHPDLNPRSTNAKLARLLIRLGYAPVETAHAKLL